MPVAAIYVHTQVIITLCKILDLKNKQTESERESERCKSTSICSETNSHGNLVFDPFQSFVQRHC